MINMGTQNSEQGRKTAATKRPGQRTGEKAAAPSVPTGDALDGGLGANRPQVQRVVITQAEKTPHVSHPRLGSHC